MHTPYAMHVSGLLREDVKYIGNVHHMADEAFVMRQW